MRYLEITEEVLFRYNIVSNAYQPDSRVFILVPNKSFGHLLNISPKKYIF